jgi:uncharacterized membrane protein YfcA
MFGPWEFVVLCLLGGVGGLMSGLLGVGGGVIFIPILDYYLKSKGLDPDTQVKFILASSLFAIIFSGLVISLKQYRMGNFYPKAIMATALPGVLSSIVMTWFIESGSWYQKDAFNLVFIALLVPLMVRMFSQRKTEEQSIEKPFPSNFIFGVTGFFTGIVTSLSGLGGGIVMVPVFSDFLKISIKKATSISTGVIPFFALPIGLFYAFSQAPVQLSPYQTGYIIYPLILPLIIGVLVVAPFGVKLSHQLKPFWIKSIFALVMLIVLTSRLMQLPFFN